MDEPHDWVSPLVEAIAGPGWCVLPEFLGPEPLAALIGEARGLLAQGGFRPAGIGRGLGLRETSEVRGDRICWIEPESAGPAVLNYLQRIERLRSELNRALCLGLFELEAHLALYPPGAFYRRHLDQFRGVESRTLSCILYLNPNWRPEDGGALRIYTDPEDPGRFFEVEPRGGTLATFLSARFEHEVMPCTRERLSLTGWLKLRP